MKIIALITALFTLSSSAQQIAFPIHASPARGSALDSYVGLVVTGAVSQASRLVVMQVSTNLVDWTSIDTNTLTAAHGKFWMTKPTDMAWTILYDYRWFERPNAFYRVKNR